MRKIKPFRMLGILGLILAIFVTSACSGTKPNQDGSAPAPTGPQKGGTVVWAGGSDASNLDPGYAYSDEDIRVIVQMYETLVTYGKSAEDIQPSLATEWSSSDGGKKWNFKLRQGVKFHDGTPFTAEAVVRSFKRLYDQNDKYYQKDKYSYFTDLLGGIITDVVPVSEHEVQFVLARPFAPFLTYLAYYSQSIVSPKALEQHNGDLARNPVGTGKFKFQNWQKDDRITLVRNDDYWGEKAYLDSVVFRVIPEAATRLLEMEQGNVHLIQQPSIDQLSRIKSNGKLDVISQASASLLYVAVNHKKPPLDNPQVRKAIAHGVNWKQIVDTVWGETGKLATSSLPEGVPGHDSSLTGFKYDPELAKQLLAQAGVTNLEIDMLAPGAPRWSQPNPITSLEMVQADLAKIGVKLNAKPLENAAVTKAIKSGDFHLAWQGWKDVPDPNNFMNALIVKTGQSRWGYNLPTLPELAEKGTATDNKDERARVYKEMQKLINDDVTLIPVAYGRDVVVVPKSLNGAYIGPDGNARLQNAYFAK